MNVILLGLALMRAYRSMFHMSHAVNTPQTWGFCGSSAVPDNAIGQPPARPVNYDTLARATGARIPRYISETTNISTQHDIHQAMCALLNGTTNGTTNGSTNESCPQAPLPASPLVISPYAQFYQEHSLIATASTPPAPTPPPRSNVSACLGHHEPLHEQKRFLNTYNTNLQRVNSELIK